MTVRVDRRLYLTADRSRVVEENDPHAAFLFCAVGDELNDDDARRFGIAEAKEARPAATKVRYPNETKRRG